MTKKPFGNVEERPEAARAIRVIESDLDSALGIFSISAIKDYLKNLRA